MTSGRQLQICIIRLALVSGRKKSEIKGRLSNTPGRGVCKMKGSQKARLDTVSSKFIYFHFLFTSVPPFQHSSSFYHHQTIVAIMRRHLRCETTTLLGTRIQGMKD